MKIKMIFILGLILTLLGCASKPNFNEESQIADPKKSFEYIKDVGSRSLRVDLKKESCPSAVSKLKDDWKLVINQINGCVAEQKWTQVEEYGNWLSTQMALSPWGPYFLSLAAENRQEFPRAYWMIELALKKTPQSGILVYQKARLHWLTGDRTKAISEFNKAIEFDRGIVDAHVLLAQILMEQQDSKKAAGHLQEAIKVEPKYIPALFALAEIRFLEKDSKSVIELARKVISLQPSHAKARVLEALAYQTLDKNWQEALLAFKKIKSLESEKKLDVATGLDIDVKIKEIEKELQQAEADKKGQGRQPAENKGAGT